MFWLGVIFTVFWIFWRLGMPKSFMVFGCLLYSFVMWFLAFLVGGFITFFISPEALRKWTISESFVTTMVNGDVSPLGMMSIPFVFVGDLIWWSVEITIQHGSWPLWITQLFAAYKIIEFWAYQINAYSEARKELVRRGVSF